MNSRMWIFVNEIFCDLYGGSGGHRELKQMVAGGGKLLVSPRVPFDVDDPSVHRIEQTGLLLRKEIKRRRQQLIERHAAVMSKLDAIDERVERWSDDEQSAKRRRDDIADDADLLHALDDYVAQLEVIE